MKHIARQGLLTNKCSVILIGCGGTGSQVLSGLARLHLSLVALGHPGLSVHAYDPDTVSNSNVGRQLFAQCDVGLNKAVVLVNRLNQYYNLNWKATPSKFQGDFSPSDGIYISCVDTKEGRRDIHNYFASHSNYGSPPYWLDCGNRMKDGQVCLGQPKFRNTPSKGKDHNPMRLPTITELYPEIMDTKIPEPDDMPTCSLAEALEKQDLYICQTVATLALQMLWGLFRNGGLDFSAQFINLQSGRVTPLAVDPAAWKRFGVKRSVPAKNAVPK
jgi:PRTRC genetic system ThiF family protein